MMKKIGWTFATLALVLSSLAVTEHEGATFLHIPSLMNTIGFTFGGLAITYGLPRVKRALVAALRGELGPDDPRRQEYATILRTGRKLAWSSLAIAVSIGADFGRQWVASSDYEPALGWSLATFAVSIPLLYVALLGELILASLARSLEIGPESAASKQSPTETESPTREESSEYRLSA